MRFISFYNYKYYRHAVWFQAQIFTRTLFLSLSFGIDEHSFFLSVDSQQWQLDILHFIIYHISFFFVFKYTVFDLEVTLRAN